MTGTLHDTYHAALQHGHVNPSKRDLVLGVVAEQMYGIQSFLDRNEVELAPDRDTLREFKDLADEIGHNEAIEELGFEDEYRERLQQPAQQAAMGELANELDAGRDVWLVCYENTDDKFCHRTILREEIKALRTGGEVDA